MLRSFAWRLSMLAVPILLSGCDRPPDFTDVQAKCESLVLSAIRSPSSYALVQHSAYAYVGEDMVAAFNAAERISFGDPAGADRIKIYLDFDAQNGFGAVIRNAAACEYRRDPATGQLFRQNANINRKTLWFSERN